MRKEGQITANRKSSNSVREVAQKTGDFFGIVKRDLNDRCGHLARLSKKPGNLLSLTGDIGIGLWLAALHGLMMNEKPSGAFAAWCIAAAFSPDFDNIEHLSRGEVSAHKDYLYDHRDRAHYPMVWAFVWLAGINALGANKWTVAAGAGAFAHFVHDLFDRWGVWFFWPFTKNSYMVFGEKWPGESPWQYVVAFTPEEKKRAMQEQGDADHFGTMFASTSPRALTECGLLVSGALLYWIARRRLRA